MLLKPSPLAHSCLALLASLLVFSGCDFGAARDAAESIGVIVQLEPIETTVSGQFVNATTGELVETPVTLRFKGLDADAPVDMYSDPIASQEVSGGVTSFGLRNGRSITSADPVHLRVVAEAEGYQTTSEVIEIHESGTREFVLSMLSTDPTRQPAEASGIRDNSDSVANSTMTADLTVETPSDERGAAALHLPYGSVLQTSKQSSTSGLTVDLSYYPPTENTLEALPGNGTIETGLETERFSVTGFMNLRLRDDTGEPIANVTHPDRPADIQTRAYLPDNTPHPSTGELLHAGDELELFRYDPEAGLWHSDTTVTIQAFGDENGTTFNGPPKPPHHPASSAGEMGIEWNPYAHDTSSWWAWGTRSRASCEPGAQLQIAPNGQDGRLQVTLQRSGLQYRAIISIEELANEGQSLGQILNQSTIPQYQDYNLVLTTRDGQTKTIEGVSPCSGTYSVTLPAPSSVPRTDALFRAYPECPGNQKMRITSVPTATIYYREQSPEPGAPWHTAGSDRISWVMDDPNNPTFIKWAELRLDGLKQDTHYEMYTTYDGDRYEASALVPARDTATIEEDRVLVEYSQDFSNVCS